MSQIKQTLSVSVPIADAMLHGIDAAAAKALNAAFKENGVPDGIPVEVEVTPRKHDYEARATWQPQAIPTVAFDEGEESEMTDNIDDYSA